MNVAEWILVAILSITLFIFLVLGIVLIVKLFGLVEEAKKVAIKSQDIADDAGGIVENVKGFTSVGGAVQSFVSNIVEPTIKQRAKQKAKERNQKDDGRKESKK